MRKKARKVREILENVEILSAGAEGMAVAKPGDKVVFVPFAAPGDVVDLVVLRKKKSFIEAKISAIHQFSKQRTAPRCQHFTVCGGCKWQHLAYEHQLAFKAQQVRDTFDRIGKFSYPPLLPIMGSEKQYEYRNKLEFTFSNRRWLIEKPAAGSLTDESLNGLGFHLPGMFDRILDIEHCHLQEEPSNAIRRAVKDYATAHGLSFYDVKKNEGLLRNLIIRNVAIDQWMVILVVSEANEAILKGLLPHLSARFPQISSLIYVVNTKKNDQISDLEAVVFSGSPFLIAHMDSPVSGQPSLKFQVGPVSFFQTNSAQAERLYRLVFNFAGFTGNETVYDLYSGTGTIALYVAKAVRKVIGIEYVEESVNDARTNALLNEIENVSFVAGDMPKVLSNDFVAQHGRPDVVITDPPRAGMHPDVVAQLLEIKAEKIVYVSCNPATQARDISLLSTIYSVEKVQPVDMFPQTQHVENVALLRLKSDTERA